MLRDNGTVKKSMGVLYSSPQTYSRKSSHWAYPLSPLSTAGACPSMLARSPPRKKSTSPSQIARVMAVAPGPPESLEDTALGHQILVHWKSTFCPRDPPYRSTGEVILGGSIQQITTADWHQTVAQAWGWIDSVNGKQGFLTKKDINKVRTLKGSEKDTKSCIDQAAKLFDSFATDWEQAPLSPQGLGGSFVGKKTRFL